MQLLKKIMDEFNAAVITSAQEVAAEVPKPDESSQQTSSGQHRLPVEVSGSVEFVSVGFVNTDGTVSQEEPILVQQKPASSELCGMLPPQG